MTLAQAVTEILQRSDEAFIGVSEARARRMFYLALTEVLRNGEFSDRDANGMIVRHEHTFPAVTHTVNLAALISNREILRIRSAYLRPEHYEGTALRTFITPVTKEEIKKWGIPELQPQYDLRYYQVGNTVYFYPTTQMPTKQIVLECITAPLPYNATPLANHWDNTTQLDTVMTTSFQNSIIEAAAQLLRQEVAINEG